MARFNAEIDDELHRNFVEYAKARSITMKELVERFIRSLLAADPQVAGAPSVVEIHFDVSVRAHLDEDGQRVRYALHVRPLPEGAP